MNLSFEDYDSPPPSPPKPVLNHRYRLNVDGPVLGILATLTSKAEAVRDEIVNEIRSFNHSKLTKNFCGESRPFVAALYDFEHVVGTTAETSRSDPNFFGEIDHMRIRAAWKEVCQAVRHISWALRQMARTHGRRKSVRVCRRYVIRALRRSVFHFGRLVAGMEHVVGGVRIDGERFGDDMFSGMLLKNRIRDWLEVKPRYLDTLLCKGPDRVMRWGERCELFD